jgi:hypothetical protein
MIYKLYWIDYDNVIDHLLEHSDKTKEQFEEDCIKAIRDVGEKYLGEELGWISAEKWISMAAEKLIDFGYKKVDTINWGHFGSDIIGNQTIDDDFNIVQFTDSDDEEWRKIVGDSFFEKALKTNLDKYKGMLDINIKKMKKEKILEDLETMRFL